MTIITRRTSKARLTMRTIRTVRTKRKRITIMIRRTRRPRRTIRTTRASRTIIITKPIRAVKTKRSIRTLRTRRTRRSRRTHHRANRFTRRGACRRRVRRDLHSAAGTTRVVELLSEQDPPAARSCVRNNLETALILWQLLRRKLRSSARASYFGNKPETRNHIK
jgi:hypothetical protein